MIQKPFNINIKGQTIDVKRDNSISWRVTGGFPVAFSIEFRRNSDNALIFTVPKISSPDVSYTLTSGKLANGHEYKIIITVWDQGGNSATSDAVVFQASSYPSVSVSPIGVVGASAYRFTANYSQSESVSLRSWILLLYDKNRILRQQSSIQTSGNIDYLVEGLESDQSYFVEIQVTSDKGLTSSSGIVPFEVSYARPVTSLSLSAENWEDASIRLQWYVAQIIGKSSNTSYIDEKKIDARKGEVWFDEGFSITNNFTLKIWIEETNNLVVSEVTEVIQSPTPPDNINALWILGEDVKKMRIISSANPPEPAEDVIWIRKENYEDEIDFNLEFSNLVPHNRDALWVDKVNPHEDLFLLRLSGENGYLLLNFYNSTFFLKRKVGTEITVIDSVEVPEELIKSSFYIYIQQIGDTYKLTVESA